MSFDYLYGETKNEFPEFCIKSKLDSRLMKMISLFLLIVTFGQQKTFMEHFTTTIGYTMYVPRNWSIWAENSRIEILRHERIHMRQARKYGKVLFGFLYIFPFFPIGLAYFRARFEWEAYTETMKAICDHRGPSILYSPIFKQQIVDHFITAEYGWMWPFKRTIESWYETTKKKILESGAVS